MSDEASAGSSALEVPLILLMEMEVFGLGLGPGLCSMDLLMELDE